ncbi:MAG: DUF4198 domain-containing protein [Magnetovibrionaceae bacterium]
MKSDDLKSPLGAVLGLAAVLIGTVGSASAHFLEVLPETSVLSSSEPKPIGIDLTFTHPMAGGPVMTLARPKAVEVLAEGRKTSLLENLEKVERQGKEAYRLIHTPEGPGAHIYYVEPEPYWEPAEDAYIVHFTKTIVDAYDGGEGWDALVGAPVEIEPLTRPFGIWSGSVFSGRVLKDGEPFADSIVEVEYRGEGRFDLPSAAFETQELKTDGNGIFHVALPRAGWWGMAALVEAPTALESPDGRQVPLEWGGALWIEARDLTESGMFAGGEEGKQ